MKENVFKTEMNTVFKNSWVPVGYTNQFIDNKKTILSNIGNESIRNLDSSLNNYTVSFIFKKD